MKVCTYNKDVPKRKRVKISIEMIVFGVPALIYPVTLIVSMISHLSVIVPAP